MMNGSCDTKKWLKTALITFVITFGFDWLVHGKLLMDQYEATASLWRPKEEMEGMMNLCIARHALMALVFSCLYMCWKSKCTMGAVGSPDCPYKKSVGFGLKIGLLLGINAAAAYIYMPIPQELAISWLVAETVKWSIAAVALTAICGRCSSSSPQA